MDKGKEQVEVEIKVKIEKKWIPACAGMTEERHRT
jgi:hypothetical protein